MSWDPDPDWYLDHVLSYARPGSSAVIRVDEVTRWRTWWRSQARALAEQRPELAAAALSSGFVLTVGQQRTLGITRASARGLVRRGAWAAPARGAVALVGPTAIAADGPDRWTADRRRHALLSAAAAAVNAGHVVTGRSAAVLHGLPVFAQPAEPELSVPSTHATRRRGARIAELGLADLTAWYGIPATTVARTVVDIARSDRRNGIVVADAALRTGQVTRAELADALRQAAQWPGVRQARDIVAFADPRAESPLESILRLAARDSRLPAPELQVTLKVPGRSKPYQVDMLWPEQRLIVEADGRVKYRDGADGSGDDARWAEKQREIALRRLGYRVERVIWSDVVHTWPATYAVLADALGL